jgi:hypothetical protein
MVHHLPWWQPPQLLRGRMVLGVSPLAPVVVLVVLDQGTSRSRRRHRHGHHQQLVPLAGARPGRGRRRTLHPLECMPQCL